MKCDNHHDREATNCSRWALRRYLCEECIAAIKAQPAMPLVKPWPDYDESQDTDPYGRNIRATEATHRVR